MGNAEKQGTTLSQVVQKDMLKARPPVKEASVTSMLKGLNDQILKRPAAADSTVEAVAKAMKGEVKESKAAPEAKAQKVEKTEPKALTKPDSQILQKYIVFFELGGLPPPPHEPCA